MVLRVVKERVQQLQLLGVRITVARDDVQRRSLTCLVRLLNSVFLGPFSGYQDSLE